MKIIKSSFIQAGICFIFFTLLCGVVYTFMITGLSQLFFPQQANGSIITVDGKKYGCELLGQQYTDDNHMWGRIMNMDTATFKDQNGKSLVYAWPSNISPASSEFKALVRERVKKIKAAHPEQKNEPIPVDLVTCSGSGLDPDISLAAADYQIARIAKNRNMSEAEVKAIVDKCTTQPVFNLLGQKTVNVLKVNLMLDGILH